MFAKLAGLMGIIGSLLGISGVLLSAFLCGVGCAEGIGDQYNSSWGPNGSFSWKTNALSDLGISNVANIFNYPLIFAGILNFIFGVGFVKVYARTILSYLGGFIMLLGVTSLSLIGIFTEAYGVLHTYVSMGFFIFVPVSIIIIGITFVRNTLITKGYYSIIAGSVALITISSYFTGWHSMLGLGFAVPELIEALILSGWVVWMGFQLLDFHSMKDNTIT